MSIGDNTRSNITCNASINTYGYSFFPLKTYLDFIIQLSDEHGGRKPFIISVTGSSDDVIECYRQITATQNNVKMQLIMEINLSCPNIPGRPPPAYDKVSLSQYVTALGFEQQSYIRESSENKAVVPVSIKTPPYTYSDQFSVLITALRDAEKQTKICPISYITATNTLGSTLVLSSPGEDESFAPACVSHDNSGIGGLAGAPLHPIALGNVYELTKRLKQHPYTENIQVLGVGGVSDADGYRRMRSVGAIAVEVGTALGLHGVGIFQHIADGLEGNW